MLLTQLWIGVIRRQLARLCDSWFSDLGKKVLTFACLAHCKTQCGYLQACFWASLTFSNTLTTVPPVYVTRIARWGKAWVSSWCCITPPYMCALLCACSFAYICWFEPRPWLKEQVGRACDFFPPISETRKIRYRAMHWVAQGHSAAEPVLEPRCLY